MLKFVFAAAAFSAWVALVILFITRYGKRVKELPWVLPGQTIKKHESPAAFTLTLCWYTFFLIFLGFMGVLAFFVEGQGVR